MLASIAQIEDLLCCPRCKSPLNASQCSNRQCGLTFPTVAGQPALIDFDDSIIDPEALIASSGASTHTRDPTHANFRTKVKSVLLGQNPVARNIGRQFHAAAREQAQRPVILVVGGGDFGMGAEAMYADPQLLVIGTNVYASSNTTLLADGHQLPIRDNSIDGVWIQAVLEHVLDPWRVVAEIHRVLKPSGLVFGNTPFLYPVHEGAFDYTRFTLSGHRWLFRHFEMISAGVTAGPPDTLNLAIRYFFQAILRNQKLGTAVSLCFFWLRFFEPLMAHRWGADAASGTYFYGRKSERAITPKDIVAFYETQKRLKHGMVADPVSGL